MSPRHLISTLDFESAELESWVDRALALKAGARADLLGRVVPLLFFNPSVRTRISCQSALARFGGQGLVISPGKDAWTFEDGEGVVMDGSTQEHVRELAPVLSRMGHAIGIRRCELITTGSNRAEVTCDYGTLAQDRFLHRLAEHAEVPVINLESNRFHPMQGLADMATMKERLGEPRGKRYTLTWAWHPKSLPVATPHSQLLAAAHLGMEIQVAHPPGYDLDPEVLAAARERTEAQGGSVTVTNDFETACSTADVICAKSWGALGSYGQFEAEAESKAPLRNRWRVHEGILGRSPESFFMHCLPIRRNVIATDAVLDSPQSAHIDQAEHRLWTAAAVFEALMG